MQGLIGIGGVHFYPLKINFSVSFLVGQLELPWPLDFMVPGGLKVGKHHSSQEMHEIVYGLSDQGQILQLQ